MEREIRDMIFKHHVYNVQKYLWTLFLYTVSALPIAFLIYVEIYIQVMLTRGVYVGNKFAAVYSYLFILIGIVFIGETYLYYGFLRNIIEALKILGYNPKLYHRVFLVLGITISIVNIVCGLYLLQNIGDLGRYIGSIAHPKNILGSIVRLPWLFGRHIFFNTYYIINTILLFASAVYVSLTLMKISRYVGSKLLRIISLVVLANGIILLLYVYVIVDPILTNLVIELFAGITIVLGFYSFRLTRRLYEIFSSRCGG